MHIPSYDQHDNSLSAAPTHLQPAPGHPTGAHSGREQAMRFGFCVGPLRLLILPQTFSEVVTQAMIYPLPNVPPWFLGVLNQRGNLLPVFDLHQMLATEDRQRDHYTVLVLDQGSDAVGIRIDGMPQALTLHHALGRVPPLPAAIAAYVPAAYSTGETVWCEFEHRGFFTVMGAQIPCA